MATARMADGSVNSVLGQKARAAQRAHEARGMSMAKALRRGLARTADDLWGLSLVCTDVAIERLDQDGVIAALDANSLMLVLDGPDGAIGVAQVDRTVLAGLTEIQTIQTVTDMPVDPRPLTHTDAAMVAPMLDEALALFAQNLGDDPVCAQIAGFRFGAMVEDVQGAALLLDASDYRAFHATLDLDGGTRSGTVLICLPVRSVAATHPETDAEPATPHAEMLSAVPTRLNCVLARLRMPLSRAEALQPGDVLPLAAQALDGVELIASNGAAVAGGRLGQMNGARAVRLAWPRVPGQAAPVASEEDYLAAPAGAAAEIPGAMAQSDDADGFGGDWDTASDAGASDALPDLPPLDPDDGGGALPDLPPLEPMGDDTPEFDIENAFDGGGGLDASDDGNDPLADLGDFAPASADFDVT